MNTPTIRMYVDENGHQSLKGDLANPNKHFLGITGIIMPIKEHDTVLTPKICELKDKYFGRSDIVLHRRELIAAKDDFQCLQNPDVREAFNSDFLQIVQDTKYRVISVLIDKKKLVDRYGLIKAQDPYALALEYLMQRYQYWMQSYVGIFGNNCGDILAEARGGGEDRLTKSTYHEIYNGRGYNRLADADKYFSSSQIKLKPKSANIAGLQFVDLIAHPARRYILSTYNLIDNLQPSSYEQKIVEILVEKKFRRNVTGKIDGVGIVLYPK